MIGKTVSHYSVIFQLGAGGMGVVYLAKDNSLDRRVALKFLPSEIENDPAARKRFIREAKSAAALDHPYICNVHEIGEFEGRSFIAMEYVQGKTIREAAAGGGLSLDETLKVASEIAEALAAAQKEGIIHRDLKPENIMLTSDGHVKVMDFGLSKRVPSPSQDQSHSPTASVTEGLTMGTLPYMSPEQLRGSELDSRSDIFSFGIILYELLTGVHPFLRETPMDTATAILKDDPPPLGAHAKRFPDRLGAILARMLAREPGSRYGSIEELRTDLASLASDPAARARILGVPRVAAMVALAAVVVVLAGYQIFQRSERSRWAREEAIPEIRQWISEDDYSQAYALALEARRYIPTDPTLNELWPQISFPVSIQVDPEGTDVYVKDYGDLEGDWEYLGTAPIENAQLSRTFKRFRLEKEGFGSIEFLGPTPSPDGVAIQRRLTEASETPEGMVRVSAAAFGGVAQGVMTGSDPIQPIELKEFWIDQNEVTNRDYKAFVDAGGYRDRAFWQEEFVREGVPMSWEEAIALFSDATGRPGPAGWVVGEYPDGQADLPVTGVSWYEAAAYARFEGKSLPTIYHWVAASGAGLASNIIPLSNFGADGPAPVGTLAGVGPFGTYDMAGNVREWASNEWQGSRYILGGAWNEPIYMFTYLNVQSPFDRTPTNGFRLVRYIDPADPTEDASRTVERVVRDYTLETPVDDSLFEVYRERFSYDPTDLAPTEEILEETDNWTKLRLTYSAAYRNERITAYLFLPKSSRPPYQTVIYFPGSGAIGLTSSDDLDPPPLSLAQSGRAVLYPVYKGTYERNDGLLSTWPNRTVEYAEYLTQWVQDFRRSVDYLETRDDIDLAKLAYFGVSWGGRMGAIIPAVEDRLQVAVLWLAGLASGRARPEVDQINYVSRVTIPVLMLNGRFDPLEPVEAAQIPMETLLGAPAADKKRIVYDTDHRIPTNAGIKETLDWLDRYLGPVN